MKFNTKIIVMENIEKIIQAIDIQFIQKNKPYMLLAEANRLLTSTRLIADNKALKKIVESGLIPHAYQTQKSPKQWRIPLSEKGKAEKEKLDKQNKQRAKENQHTIQTQISDQPTLCCPFCGYTGIIPEQFRSEQYLICPCCHSRLDNPLWIERDRAINKKIKKISFILVIVISVIYVVFDDGSSSFDENPVTNSGLDASVYQVEQFLDDNLRDPDSYESIDWSPVTETENGYYVRHKYRTRNGFGGMNIENKIFHLDKNGNVTGYTDY